MGNEKLGAEVSIPILIYAIALSGVSYKGDILTK